MSNQQPIITSTKGREFAAFAGSVGAYIVDEQERILLLSHPNRFGTWEIINGALDAEETLLEATIRETYEEAGPHIKFRPLGVVHAYTYPYDGNVRHLQCTTFVFAYEGGKIVPGDDMRDSTVYWATVDEIVNHDFGDLPFHYIIPGEMDWTFKHAVDLYNMLKDRPESEELQPTFTKHHSKNLTKGKP